MHRTTVKVIPACCSWYTQRSYLVKNIWHNPN